MSEALLIPRALAIKVGMKAMTCPEASDWEANQAQPREGPRRIEMTVEFSGGVVTLLEVVAGTILEGRLDGNAGVVEALAPELVWVAVWSPEMVEVDVGWLMRRVEVGTQLY